MVPKIAETMNGALVIDIVFALFMFVTFLVFETKNNGMTARARAALGIVVFLAGDTILRGWFLIWRRMVTRGTTIPWDGWNVAMCGMGIEMFGVLLIIRAFSPDAWPKNSWVALGLIALVASFSFAQLL